MLKKLFNLLIEKLRFHQELSKHYFMMSLVFNELDYTWPAFLMWLESLTHKLYLSPLRIIIEWTSSHTIEVYQWEEALKHYRRNMPRFKS